MREIMDDWRIRRKELEICQVYEFEIARPLTKNEIRELEEGNPEWAEAIKIELVQ